MEKKFFYAPVPPLRCGKDLAHRWLYEVPAYRLAPHVWNVGGQDDVSVYLLDSGDGLILIDTAYEQTLYMVIDRIHRIGYDPKDIKMILLSHWHGDHVNGARYLQEMTGGKAEIWISKEDEVEHQAHKDDLKPMPTTPYEVDHFYDEAKPIELGRFKIYTKLCPGHTPGCTSYRFEDTDEETGETFQVAMHGGIGVVPALKPENLAARGDTPEVAFRFIQDATEMLEWKVDIMLPSHLNQGGVMENFPEDVNDYHHFVTDYAWQEILTDRINIIKSYYPEKYGK